MLLNVGESEGSSQIISKTFGSVLTGLEQLLLACFLGTLIGSSLRCWLILFRLSNSCRQCLQLFQFSRLLLRLKQSYQYLDLYFRKALPSASSKVSDFDRSPSMMQFCYSTRTSNSSNFSSIVKRLALRIDMSLIRSFRYSSTSLLEQEDRLCSFSKILLNCRYFSYLPLKSQQSCSCSSVLRSSYINPISDSCTCRYAVFCSQLRYFRSCSLRLPASMALVSCSISARNCSALRCRLLALPASTCSSLISSSTIAISFSRSAFSP